MKKSPAYGCCFRPSSLYVTDSLEAYPCVPCPSAPSLSTGVTVSYWCMWLLLFKLSKGFDCETIPLRSHSVYLQYYYVVLSQRAFESGMKERKSSSLPWITYRDLKLDLTYWEGRQSVLPNKAQPPWHVQNLTPLPPSFGARGSAVVARMKALSPACSQAKAAGF